MKLSDATKIMRGTAEVLKIYQGATQVWIKPTGTNSTLFDYTFPLLSTDGATTQNESAIIALANTVDSQQIIKDATRIMLPMASKVSTIYAARLSNSTIENWVYALNSSHYGYDQYGYMTTKVAHEPRFNIVGGAPYGYLLERDTTNLFLNSSAPATQTITTTTGGLAYVCWVEGSGSVTLSGGITGTATAGSPVISTASTTSVTLTVSGTLTHVQFEKTQKATSKLATTGVSASRVAHEVRTPDSSAVTSGAWTAIAGSCAFWITGLEMFSATTTWFQLCQTVNSTSSNGIRLRSLNGLNDVSIVILRGGTTVVAETTISGLDMSSGGTGVITWSGAAITSLTVTLYWNGAQVWQGTGLNMPTLVQAKFNNNTGHIRTGLRGMFTWNKALTLAEVQTFHNTITTTQTGTLESPPAPTIEYGGPYSFPEDSAITPITPTATGSGVTYSISPALPTGLSLNTSTGVISGTPTTPTAQATYTITATNVGGSAQDTVQITITEVVAPTYRTFHGDPPTFTPTVNTNDATPVSLGVVFQVKFNGTIHGLRVHKPSVSADATYSIGLWSFTTAAPGTGTLLGSKSAGTLSGGGWKTIMFDAPISVTTGTYYVAGYYVSNGHYSNTLNYFSSSSPGDPTNAPGGQMDTTYLNAPPSNTTGIIGNGRYGYSGSMIYPGETYLQEHYWVDVLFVAN